MLGSIRKFSKTLSAKILLAFIIIPFVFWGMGTSFTGGNKNIVLVIDKDKYSTQKFIQFIKKLVPVNRKFSSDQIEELLSLYISEMLIEKEVEELGITFSDESLGKLIKNLEEFKRENIFSRIEYEKFLLENGMTAVSFESNLSNREKKKQLLNFIGGGLMPANFLVNNSYNKINQKRNVQIIDLNQSFENEFNFTKKQISTYFEKNKNIYNDVFKLVKISELNPNNLVSDNEFTDLFFKRIDEIDDMILKGHDLESINKKFNLKKAKMYTVNKLGQDINSNKIDYISKNLINHIFAIINSEPTVLVESDDKYFLLELTNTKNIQKKLDNKNVRKEVLISMKKDTKKKLISEIIAKINLGTFNKSDFDKYAERKNLNISKTVLKNQNDDKTLKKELVNQIYNFTEKKTIVVHDLNFSENFLIYIDKIENVTISKNSNEYNKYLNLTKLKIRNELFNTYDNYIRGKYKIDINYKSLDVIKNYFD